jgi:o-succinylbenzoate synthase
MRISSSRLLPYRLPLRQAWRTHLGTITERLGWIVELTTDDGCRGYGDCAPLPAAGTESDDLAQAWLQQQLPGLVGQAAAEALDALALPTATPAARHALETALLDLVSNSEALSLRRWLSPRAVDRLAVNGSAGPLDAHTRERCLTLVAQGFSVLKLKVGLADVKQELLQLQALCRLLPAGIRLRLDANGAWSLSEAQRFLEGVAGLAIESLEEPLAKPDLQALRWLQAMSRIALALDESLPRLPRERLLSQPPVRRLILKPTLLGGLRPALALAEQAARAGMETLVTSTLESALGLQAAAQLAAALPRSGRALAQGLATGSWFTRDLAHGLAIEQGEMRLPDTPGLGIRLKPEFFDKE